MWLLVLQRVLFQSVWDILWFPLWWYSAGLFRAIRGIFDIFEEGNASLAPGLWLKNMFVPMFGQSDLQGRIVSIIVRFGNVIVRGIALCVWLVLCFGLFCIYVGLPMVITWGLIVSFLSIFSA